MAERGNGSTDATDGPAAPGGRSATGSPPPEDVLDLKARLDRFGELLARGLDLAEAGLSLGMTMLSTVGGAAQANIMDRVLNPDRAEGRAPRAAEPAARDAAGGQGMEPPAGATPAYGITNRLPLRPGGTVRISFSINNDSAEAAKPVRFLVETFAGEKTGAVLPEGVLGISPGEIAIQPMDFEKFLLLGTIPETLPPDLYRGSLLVLGEGPMRIPVVLTVEARE